MAQSTYDSLWKDLLSYLDLLGKISQSDTDFSLNLRVPTQFFLESILNRLHYLKQLDGLSLEKEAMVQLHIEELEKYLFNAENSDKFTLEEEVKQKTPIKPSRKEDLLQPQLSNDKPSIDDVRFHVWALANAEDQKEIEILLTQWKARHFNSHFSESIPDHPTEEDLVLFGTAIDTQAKGPIYIAPFSWLQISKDNSIAEKFAGKDIWLSFEQNWHERSADIRKYPYIENRPFFKELFNAWSNFINWVLLVPKAIILNDNKMVFLHDSLDEFCGIINLHDINLKTSLQSLEISHGFPARLHYIYTSACGQVFCENSLNKTDREEHVFDRISNILKRAKNDCLHDLSLQEDTPIGFDFTGNFLTQVSAKTKKNILIKPEFKSFLGVKNNEKGKVIYWFQPVWYLDESDKSNPPHKGGVLYI